MIKDVNTERDEFAEENIKAVRRKPEGKIDTDRELARQEVEPF
jgi:hypothetical protein